MAEVSQVKNYCIDVRQSKPELAECMNSVEETFEVKVDWGTWLGGESCHARSLFIGDEGKISIQFTRYSDGYVKVNFGGEYLLSQDNYLLQLYPITRGSQRETRRSWDAPFTAPYALYALGVSDNLPKVKRVFCDKLGCSDYTSALANSALATCYSESGSLNAALTAGQRAVVDRFFAAVRNTYPQQFVLRKVKTE